MTKYLRTRAVTGPWRLEGETQRNFSGAVVIPALGEGASLFATLESLAQNPAACLETFLIVVVVNHRPDAAPELQRQNRRDLERLASGNLPAGLHLARIDAASPGLELPARDGGVGLARKIGCDLALPRLDYADAAGPLLLFLDADTLVEPDYLPTLVRHFRDARAGGAVIPFRHRPAANTAQERAIRRYELFLRSYVLGLELAGSPYAFHTVGSTIACRAAAYAGVGGMNRRRAGEDFYFLQQLAKTTGVDTVYGTTVHPSGRVSARTPFGTGPSVGRLLDGDDRAVRLYHPHCFRILAAWLELVARRLSAPATDLLPAAREISPHLEEFLEEAEFAAVWPRLQQNHTAPGPRYRAFHRWFDGLKSLRLVHRLSAGPLPRQAPESILPEYLQWVGLATGGQDGLEVLRRHQGVQLNPL